ncbi:MAG: hypothetical protein JNK78_09090 [Planctomycetes bacterium]|nr:hypothetical protein [Planctomycetota bacterium]
MTNGEPTDPGIAALAAADAADAQADGPAALARRDAVLALRAAGAVRGGAAALAAARILLRSSRATDVEAAQALAHSAMANERAARRVAAAAFDRLRMLAGKPQKFGTQTVADAAGTRLWPVDPATTDSERAKWDVPPLADLVQRCGRGGG